MSEFHVTVVRLGQMTQHPNADTLNITKVFDYQVITKKGGFQEGELVVYIPVDSVVPDNEEWHWLCPLDESGQPRFPVGQVPEKYRVIEAKKLRGIFSQGVLAPLPIGCAQVDDVLFYMPKYNEGDDVAKVMGITKYEPPTPVTTGGEAEASPVGWQFPVYTDIEGLRRYPSVLHEGEEVVITEKIHGANARYVHDGDRLWVGSHTQIKKFDETNLWWRAAHATQLGVQLEAHPFLVFFGEVYGQVQDLKYGHKSGASFRVFDVYDVKLMKYLDFDDAQAITKAVGLQWVPTLYRGPWSTQLNELCEGKSTIVGADNVREGFVVRPVKERWHPEVGRVILKRHGEGYLLRKKK
jgi:RNA ligase (TIGR02306 family)